jgi:hypothetical protein
MVRDKLHREAEGLNTTAATLVVCDMLAMIAQSEGSWTSTWAGGSA